MIRLMPLKPEARLIDANVFERVSSTGKCEYARRLFALVRWLCEQLASPATTEPITTIHDAEHTTNFFDQQHFSIQLAIRPSQRGENERIICFNVGSAIHICCALGHTEMLLCILGELITFKGYADPFRICYRGSSLPCLEHPFPWPNRKPMDYLFAKDKDEVIYQLQHHLRYIPDVMSRLTQENDKDGKPTWIYEASWLTVTSWLKGCCLFGALKCAQLLITIFGASLAAEKGIHPGNDIFKYALLQGPTMLKVFEPFERQLTSAHKFSKLTETSFYFTIPICFATLRQATQQVLIDTQVKLRKPTNAETNLPDQTKK